MKCQFCDMGEAKRRRINKLTRDLSKSDISFLLKNKIIEKALEKKVTNVSRRMPKNIRKN
jgi:hypothetical protein